jgi:hypothetical protein
MYFKEENLTIYMLHIWWLWCARERARLASTNESDSRLVSLTDSKNQTRSSRVWGAPGWACLVSRGESEPVARLARNKRDETSRESLVSPAMSAFLYRESDQLVE